MTFEELPSEEEVQTNVEEQGDIEIRIPPKPYVKYFLSALFLIFITAILSFCCGIIFAGSLSQLSESFFNAEQTAVTQNVVIEFGITQIAVTQVAVTRIIVEEPPTPLFSPIPSLTPLVTDTQTPESLPSDPQPIGQPVAITGYTITLNSVAFEGNVVTADFTVQNTGSLVVSVFMSTNFRAQDSDGTLLDPAILSCPTAIEGEILPGESLRGTACWNGPFTEVIRIYFSPDPFLPLSVLWEVSQ